MFLNRKAVYQLLVTQFLSALADNAILLATIYIINQAFFGNEANVYIGIVQASFFVAYILLAPYVGAISERIPKANTMWIGNIIKITGAVALFSGINPAFSYFLVGVGACLYGVGKYAILRELTDNKEDLYKANGWVDGSTIVSILGGTVIGEILVKQSVTLAMVVILSIYAVSLVLAYFLPKGSVNKEIKIRTAWKTFFKDIKTLASTQEVRSILLGTSSFWMISAVVRISMLAWIPVALSLSPEDNVSYYLAAIAIGIMCGSLVAPKIIPLSKLKRTVYSGIGLSLVVACLGLVGHSIGFYAVLFFAGFLGGTYVIPLNTTLQERGKVVGSGKTIAIQNFTENIMMVTGTLTYSASLKLGATIPSVLIGFGIVFLLITFYVRNSLKETHE